MASVWPLAANTEGFEREGDKLYLAPEVLQGRYGKAADVFRLVSRFARYSLDRFSRLIFFQLWNDDLGNRDKYCCP